MAQHVEPMDLDEIHDDKENSLTVSNVLATGDDTEPVESNMKTRYSNSLSKSFAGNVDSKIIDQSARTNNMTQSLNANVPKSLPLQNVTADITQDPNETNNILRQLDSCISDKTSDITVHVEDIDYNLSLPSSSSSTPEATTPTKEIPKSSGSPIMRSLQSVFNIFRPSIVPDEGSQKSNLDITVQNTHDDSVIASTPLVSKKKSEDANKPDKVVFNDDLEKDLLWEETQIIFSKKEKVPIHKLFFQPAKPLSPDTTLNDVSMVEMAQSNTTLEAMEVSYNDSILNNKTQAEQLEESTNTQSTIKEVNESGRDDSVFLDCENPSQGSVLNDTQTANNMTEGKIINETALLENTYINDNKCNTGVPIVKEVEEINVDSSCLPVISEHEIKSDIKNNFEECSLAITDFKTIESKKDTKIDDSCLTNENNKEEREMEINNQIMKEEVPTDAIQIVSNDNEINEIAEDDFVDLKNVDVNLIINSEEPTSNNVNSEVTDPENHANLNDTKEIDNKERIVVSDDIVTTSEESSPFVSIQAEDEITPLESFQVKKTITPPSSPKILAKGFYNFDFDNIDNPFVPKSKIRNSPPPNPNASIDKSNTDTNDTSVKEEFKSIENQDATFNKDHCGFPANEILDQIDNHNHENIVQSTESDGMSKFELQDNNEIFNRTDILDKTVEIDTQKVIDDLVKPIKAIDITTTLSTTISDVQECFQNDDFKLYDNKTVQIETENHNNEFIKPVGNNVTTTLSSSFSKDERSLNVTHEIQERIETKSNILQTDVSEASKTSIANDNEFKPFNNNITTTLHSNDEFQPELDMTHTIPEIKVPEQSILKSAYRNSQENLENLDFKMTENINDFNKIDTADINSKDAPKSDMTICIENPVISEQMTSSQNTDCSVSSKNSSDRDITVREVNTEDDDTAEGPFIESHLEEFKDKTNDLELENIKPEEIKDKTSVLENENIKVDFFDFVRPKDPTTESSEMFIDAKAFEFLMNQNQSCEISDNGKESLFLKFDPLFAKRVNSDGIVEALAKVQKRQSTPKKMTAQLLRLSNDFGEGPSSNYPACEESTILHDESADFNLTVNHKPTMVVTPAVAGVSKSDCSPFSPSRRNRTNATFCSPAMTVVDRLLSLSGNNSFNNDNTQTVAQDELERNLTELRELVAEKELQNYHFKAENKELKDRLTSMQSKLSTLETESNKRLENVNDLTNQLAEKKQLNSQMEKVVEEYEKTIGALINKLEEDKKRNADEKMELIKERDEQTSHLLSMEVAFNDLHSKYEKAKQVIMSYKDKFDEYRKSQETFEATVAKIQNNYDALKQHATEKLNFANQELEKINKSHESDVLKLNAMLRRKELQITNLEETLAQKTKAIEELTAICDELINKVG